MGILAFIGVVYIIYKLCDEHQCNKTYPGKHDWDASMKDCIDVNTGKLSQHEYNKRMKTGYYNK